VTRMLNDTFPEAKVNLETELALVTVTGSLLKPDGAHEILRRERIDVYAASSSSSGKSVCVVVRSEYAEQCVRIFHSHVIT